MLKILQLSITNIYFDISVTTTMNGDCDINFSSMIDTRMEKIHEKSLEQDTEEPLRQSDDKSEDESEEHCEEKNTEVFFIRSTLIRLLRAIKGNT